MQLLLQLSAIDKAFAGVQALRQAELRVYPGEVMALMGENGAGKSTLMKILTGIYQADGGRLEYQGQARWFQGPRDSQQAGISIIHQELNLHAELSIGENIFLGREPQRFGCIDWRRLYQHAAELLQRLGLNLDPRQRLGDLSLGAQQMVEIAKALAFESRVIIMDEPTDALTDTEAAQLFRVINELKAEGRGIVYISHRLPEVFALSDRISVLRDGQFIREAATAEWSEDSLIEAMVGRSLDDYYPYQSAPLGEQVLTLDNLHGQGVKGVSLSLHAGEVVGLSGLIGAGRTELMKLIYAASPVRQGQIHLLGQAVQWRSPAEALAAGVVYISEDRKGEGLVLGLSVLHNISLSALPRFCHASGLLQHRKEQQQARELVQQLRIKTPSLEQPLINLSGGNQQKVAIAKALLCQPRVLILDEPTRGIDVGARKEIYQLINQLKQQGLAILLVSSDMPEVLGLSDRILVMHEGRLAGQFSRAEATQENLLAAAVGQAVSESK